MTRSRLHYHYERVSEMMVDGIEAVHVDYPHEPGRLDSCLACSIECFCWDEDGPVDECVYCAAIAEEL